MLDGPRGDARKKCAAAADLTSALWVRRNGRVLGLHVTAARARAQLHAGVEVLDGALQLSLDVRDVQRDRVDLGVAPIAEPHERLRLRRRALHLDDESQLSAGR